MDCTIRLCASRLAGVTAWTYLSIVMLAFACRGQRFDTDEEALAAGVKLGQHQIDIGCEPKTPIVVNG
jgi:hypothetical protein